MRNTLAFLAASVIAVGAVGYYLDWFSVRSKMSKDGHRRIVVDVNTDKIGEDAHKAKQKLAEKAEKAKKEKESAAPTTMPHAEDESRRGRHR